MRGSPGQALGRLEHGVNRSSAGGNPPHEGPNRTKREGFHASDGNTGQANSGNPSLNKERTNGRSGSFGKGNGSKRGRRSKPADAGNSHISGDHNIAGSAQSHSKSGEKSQAIGTQATEAHVAAGSANPTSPHQGRKKRRRGRGARNRSRENSAGPSHTNIRNLRAPARQTTDVTYHPTKTDEQESTGNGSRSQEKHTAPGAGNHSSRNRFDNGRTRRGQANSVEKNLYAALDLGTNNCRLLVALPQETGRFRVVDAFSRIVRLGEGLANTGRLSDEAMDRSLEALRVCAGKLRNKGIRRFRLIATEACRQAENGEEFLARVKDEVGLDLEIVNRETEARLAAEGCGTLMDRKADGAVLFDIGGGSSELILIDRKSKGHRGVNNTQRRITDRIAAWTSLPLGVVTLAERFGGKHVTRELFDSMVEDVLGHIDRFEDKDSLSRIWQKGRVHLLGTSGTVTTIAGVHLKLPKYDRRKVDGVWLQAHQIDAVIDTLVAMDYEQRSRNPCIGSDRADLVLAGCAILEAIRKTWPCERLRVADRGLREGLLTEMISRDDAWTNPKRGRWPRNSRQRWSSGRNERSGSKNNGGAS